jgi:hypothetical protein
LRVFRTEAVRVGLRHACHERDYDLIVKVAERLPPSVLQEDAGLLMYYDNALMCAEEEPVQGQLSQFCIHLLKRSCDESTQTTLLT